MNGKRQIKGKLDHVEKNDVCRFYVNVILNPNDNVYLLIGSWRVFMFQIL